MISISNKTKMIEYLLILLTVFAIISYAWYGAEMIMYGSSQSSDIDTIFAFWFSCWFTRKILDK